jgi:hypothetical protein
LIGASARPTSLPRVRSRRHHPPLPCYYIPYPLIRICETCHYTNCFVHAAHHTPNEPMTLISRAPGQSPLLSLPPELRSQIYEYVVGSRVVHIRMSWAGIFSPRGYSYSCFNSLQPLLDSPTRDLFSKAVPFDTDVTTLGRVCRQMHQDTSLMPFKLWIWAFEDAFTLDQFVTARGLGSIPMHHKEAIRKVAVAPPGHHKKYFSSVMYDLLRTMIKRSQLHQHLVAM